VPCLIVIVYLLAAEEPAGARLDVDEAELRRIERLLDSIFTPTPVELVKIVLYRQRQRRRGILRCRETGTGNRTRGDGAETGSRVESVCTLLVTVCFDRSG